MLVSHIVIQANTRITAVKCIPENAVSVLIRLISFVVRGHNIRSAIQRIQPVEAAFRENDMRRQMLAGVGSFVRLKNFLQFCVCNFGFAEKVESVLI